MPGARSTIPPRSVTPPTEPPPMTPLELGTSITWTFSFSRRPSNSRNANPCGLVCSSRLATAFQAGPPVELTNGSSVASRPSEAFASRISDWTGHRVKYWQHGGRGDPRIELHQGIEQGLFKRPRGRPAGVIRPLQRRFNQRTKRQDVILGRHDGAPGNFPRDVRTQLPLCFCDDDGDRTSGDRLASGRQADKRAGNPPQQ